MDTIKIEIFYRLLQQMWAQKEVKKMADMMPYDMGQQFLLQKEQEEVRRDMREIDKARIKAEITENIRIRAQEVRRANKERADERKRGLYETIELTSTGEIRVITKNLSVPTIPREITNMRNPQGEIFRRSNNPNERVFRLVCNVGEQTVHTYFKCESIGSGTYVLKRMAAKGISIWANTPKAKKYAVDILVKLIREAHVYQVADSPGWVKSGKDHFSFVSEDSITWEYLLEVVK